MKLYRPKWWPGCYYLTGQAPLKGNDCSHWPPCEYPSDALSMLADLMANDGAWYRAWTFTITGPGVGPQQCKLLDVFVKGV